MPGRLDQVAPYREAAGAPLAQHMEILVQDQVRVAPELSRGILQQNEIATSRGARTQM